MVFAMIVAFLAVVPASTLANIIQCTCNGYSYKTDGTCSTATGIRINGNTRITTTAPNSCYFDSTCFNRGTNSVSCWDLTMTIILSTVGALVLCCAVAGWCCFKKRRQAKLQEQQQQQPQFFAAEAMPVQYQPQPNYPPPPFSQEPSFPPPQNFQEPNYPPNQGPGQSNFIQEPNFPPPGPPQQQQPGKHNDQTYGYQEPSFPPPPQTSSGQPNYPPPSFKN